VEGNLRGVKANISGTVLTHIMYADDIILLAKANSRDASTLNKCVEKYCCWSGQLVNRNKSGVTFSKHVQKAMMRNMKQILQMKTLNKDVVYLGVPMFISRSSTKDFSILQERLESRLKGWRSKCLSWTGRCTLIKSVAQALPNYTVNF
jgi:hypothetical protein